MVLIVNDNDHSVPFKEWWSLAISQPEERPGCNMVFTEDSIIVIYDEDVKEMNYKKEAINLTIRDIRPSEDKYDERDIENYFMIDINLNECSEQELQEMSIIDRDFW